MSPVAALSLDDITTMTSHQARVMAATGKLAARLRHLVPTLETVLERYGGAPVKVRVVMPLEPSDAMTPLPGPGFQGLAIRLRVLEPPLDLLVMLPGTMCRALAGNVMTGGGTFEMDDSVQQAVVVHLLADVMRALPTDVPTARISGATRIDEGDGAMFDTGDVVMHLRVRTGALRDLVTLVIPTGQLLELAHSPLITARMKMAGPVKQLVYPLSLVMGSTTLTLRQIQALRPTDIVIVDRVARGWTVDAEPESRFCDLGLHASSRSVFLARARIRGKEAVLIEGGPMVLEDDMKQEDERTMVDSDREQDDDSTEEVLDRVKELPARVVVEAGRTEMTVQELLEVTTGSVIPLGRPPSMEVTLTVQGRELAHGVLVKVEGELGVKVLRVLR